MKVGDFVLLRGKSPATIRFIGSTFKPGVWYGIELDRKCGKNDGAAQGVRYFTCPPGHGLFVRQEDLVPFTTDESQAARNIQRVFRGGQDRKEARMDRAREVWSILEADDEHRGIKSEVDAGRVKQMLRSQGNLPKESKRELAGGLTGLASFVNGNSTENFDIVADPNFDGITVNFPLSVESVLEIADGYRQNKQLHPDVASRILKAAALVLGREPVMTEVAIPANGQVTIVGDTHGSLADVLNIFHMNGIPGLTNIYVFNGDFVDRGHQGTEVVLLLCAWKILYPNHFFVNRGNHESKPMNQMYNFEEECVSKYDTKMYDRFLRCFFAMPLCCRVAERILVMHGGLFKHDGVTLKHLAAIKRKRECKIGSQKFEDSIFEDILWSDPRSQMGRWKSDRGAGIHFGPDVTLAFCHLNDLDYVIRSHEMIRTGYRIDHEGKMITIFSASNYCGMGNEGAFITVHPGPELEYTKFKSPPIGSLPVTEFAPEVIEQEVIDKIIERICTHKSDLAWYYSHLEEDGEHDKVEISRVDWANGLKSVLNLDLPFLNLQPHIAPALPNGRINYVLFLERYHIEMEGVEGWQDAIVESICHKICKQSDNLRDAFATFDVDGNGVVSYEEFFTVLQELDLDISDQQIYEIMRSTDTNQDDQIDFEEFVERFQLCFIRVQVTHAEDEEASPALLDNMLVSLSKKMIENKGALEDAFSAYDTDNNNKLSVDEFVTALTTDLQVDVDKEDLRWLAQTLDTDHSGEIDWSEFSAAFKFADKRKGSEWAVAIIQQISAVLYQNRTQLKQTFKLFDGDNSGSVDVEEFKHAMGALNLMLQYPMTEPQIEELMKSLDKNGDGQIDYKEFLQSFKVVQRMPKAEEKTADGGEHHDEDVEHHDDWH